MTLKKEDLDEILEDEEIVIKCEFCDKIYRFKKEDIIAYQSHVQDR